MVNARVIFKGRVQGVFFRANTKEIANSLGITGWVRNLPDGSVEALFSGPREKIEAAIHKCRTGQPYASVSDAEIDWLDNEAGTIGFVIRY